MNKYAHVRRKAMPCRGKEIKNYAHVQRNKCTVLPTLRRKEIKHYAHAEEKK
jgi:hypothetical protein